MVVTTAKTTRGDGQTRREGKKCAVFISVGTYFARKREICRIGKTCRQHNNNINSPIRFLLSDFKSLFILYNNNNKSLFYVHNEGLLRLHCIYIYILSSPFVFFFFLACVTGVGLYFNRKTSRGIEFDDRTHCYCSSSTFIDTGVQ